MDYVMALFGGAVGAAVVNGVFSLVKWRLERKAKKEDEDAGEQSKDSEAQAERIQEILTAQEDLRTALRVMMHDKIKYLAKKYIAREYVTSEELEDLIAMHDVYHNELKGNGFLDELMKKVKSLPVHN